MAMDLSRFGTRISLSDRFSLIRKEAQKRAIMVNPTIDPPNVPKEVNKTMKNFNGTVSRADRPSATLQQGSERNRRLLFQMAVAPSVLAEINHQPYNPQIQAQIPVYAAAVTNANIRNQPPVAARPALQPVPPQRKSIRQRLGVGQNGANAASVKSRLGIKRKPISQRIGIKPALNGMPMRNRNLNGVNGNLRPTNLRAKNAVAFKRKAPLPKFNQTKGQVKTMRTTTKPITRKPINRTRKPVTVADLDQELDGYMQKTKGYLNADLDAYMSQL